MNEARGLERMVERAITAHCAAAALGPAIDTAPLRTHDLLPEQFTPPCPKHGERRAEKACKHLATLHTFDGYQQA